MISEIEINESAIASVRSRCRHTGLDTGTGVHNRGGWEGRYEATDKAVAYELVVIDDHQVHSLAIAHVPIVPSKEPLSLGLVALQKVGNKYRLNGSRRTTDLAKQVENCRMKRRRLLSLLAIPALVIATVSVAATPASASSTVTVALNCNVAAPVTVTAAIGDTLVINAAANCDQLINSQADPSSPVPSGFLGLPASTPAGFTFGSSNYNADDWYLIVTTDPNTAPFSVSMQILATNSSGTLSSGDTLGVFAPNRSGATPYTYYPLVFSTSGGSGGATSGSAPAPVFQAVALPASGKCTDVTDKSLNWGGAGSGGWGQSWQQWANAGKGGAVCQRTLTWTSNGWIVQ